MKVSTLVVACFLLLGAATLQAVAGEKLYGPGRDGHRNQDRPDGSL